MTPPFSPFFQEEGRSQQVLIVDSQKSFPTCLHFFGIGPFGWTFLAVRKKEKIFLATAGFVTSFVSADSAPFSFHLSLLAGPGKGVWQICIKHFRLPPPFPPRAPITRQGERERKISWRICLVQMVTRSMPCMLRG